MGAVILDWADRYTGAVRHIGLGTQRKWAYLRGRLTAPYPVVLAGASRLIPAHRNGQDQP